MILGISVASSKETTLRVMSLMGPAARFHCRADLPMLRLRHITLSGRSCSYWIVLRQSGNSTLQELLVRSDSRDSHTRCRPTRRKLTKKEPFYEPQTLSGSLAILTI